MGWRGRGSTKRARLAFRLSFLFFFFFSTGCRQKGMRGQYCKVSLRGRGRWQVEILVLSLSLGRRTIDLRGKIKF